MTAARTATLRSLIGKQLGPTPWMQCTQHDVEQFGLIVGDKQWIHVDSDRAERESPFGRTILHGALVLSLATTFAGRLLPTDGASMVINGGMASARLRKPILVGTRVCGVASIREVDDLGDATLAIMQVSVTADGEISPAASAVMKMVIHD